MIKEGETHTQVERDLQCLAQSRLCNQDCELCMEPLGGLLIATKPLNRKLLYQVSRLLQVLRTQTPLSKINLIRNLTVIFEITGRERLRRATMIGLGRSAVLGWRTTITGLTLSRSLPPIPRQRSCKPPLRFR